MALVNSALIIRLVICCSDKTWWMTIVFIFIFFMNEMVINFEMFCLFVKFWICWEADSAFIVSIWCRCCDGDIVFIEQTMNLDNFWACKWQWVIFNFCRGFKALSCFLHFQDISELPKKTSEPVLEWRVSGLSTQSASLYFGSCGEESLEKKMPHLDVSFKYLIMRKQHSSEVGLGWT